MTEAEITSYTEAIEVMRARVGQLEMRYQDFDELAGFPAGLSGKVFGLAQVRRLGPEKMFDAIRALGMRIRLEVDPEQTAKMQARIADNFNPRQANQARMNNHASPVGTALLSRVFKHMSRLGNDARKRKMTREERAESARHAATQRWIEHRRRKKAGLKAAKTRKQRLRLEGKGE